MNEYIERKSLIEDFELCNGKNPKWTPQRVKTLIFRQNVADVEPVRHGYWDGISESCSVCGEHWASGMVNNAEDWGYFDPMPDYCPYCGARMDL